MSREDFESVDGLWMDVSFPTWGAASEIEDDRDLILAAYAVRGELSVEEAEAGDTTNLHEAEARIEYWQGQLDNGLSREELLGEMLYQAAQGNEGLNTDEEVIAFRERAANELLQEAESTDDAQELLKHGGDLNKIYPVDGVGGATQYLDAGANTMIGTSANNTFIAELDADAFDGDKQTLTSNDSINGRGGENSLYAQINGNAVGQSQSDETTPNLTDVQILNFQSLDADQEISLSNTSGAEQIWSNESTQDLDVNDVQEEAVVGMHEVREGADYSVEFDDGVYGRDDSMDVVLDGVRGDGAELMVGNPAGQMSVTALEDSVNTLTEMDVDGVWDLSIQADGDVAIDDLDTSDELQNLELAGDGAIHITDTSAENVRSVDASTTTAGVTVALDAQEAIGGSDFEVLGGEGDDVFYIGQALESVDTFNAELNLDGGSGDNVLAVSGGLGQEHSGHDLDIDAAISNFQTLGVTGGNYDLSAYESFTAVGVLGGSDGDFSDVDFQGLNAERIDNTVFLDGVDDSSDITFSDDELENLTLELRGDADQEIGNLEFTSDGQVEEQLTFDTDEGGTFRIDGNLDLGTDDGSDLGTSDAFEDGMTVTGTGLVEISGFTANEAELGDTWSITVDEGARLEIEDASDLDVNGETLELEGAGNIRMGADGDLDLDDGVLDAREHSGNLEAYLTNSDGFGEVRIGEGNDYFGLTDGTGDISLRFGDGDLGMNRVDGFADSDEIDFLDIADVDEFDTSDLILYDNQGNALVEFDDPEADVEIDLADVGGEGTLVLNDVAVEDLAEANFATIFATLTEAEPTVAFDGAAGADESDADRAAIVVDEGVDDAVVTFDNVGDWDIDAFRFSGDIDTIELDGVGSDFTINNLAAGPEIKLTGAIGAGGPSDYVTIADDAGERTVIVDTNAPALNMPGVETLTLQGTSDGGTSKLNSLSADRLAELVIAGDEDLTISDEIDLGNAGQALAINNTGEGEFNVDGGATGIFEQDIGDLSLTAAEDGEINLNSDITFADVSDVEGYTLSLAGAGDIEMGTLSASDDAGDFETLTIDNSGDGDRTFAGTSVNADNIEELIVSTSSTENLDLNNINAQNEDLVIRFEGAFDADENEASKLEIDEIDNAKSVTLDNANVEDTEIDVTDVSFSDSADSQELIVEDGGSVADLDTVETGDGEDLTITNRHEDGLTIQTLDDESTTSRLSDSITLNAEQGDLTIESLDLGNDLGDGLEELNTAGAGSVVVEAFGATTQLGSDFSLSVNANDGTEIQDASELDLNGHTLEVTGNGDLSIGSSDRLTLDDGDEDVLDASGLSGALSAWVDAEGGDGRVILGEQTERLDVDLESDSHDLTIENDTVGASVEQLVLTSDAEGRLTFELTEDLTVDSLDGEIDTSGLTLEVDRGADEEVELTIADASGLEVNGNELTLEGDADRLVLGESIETGVDLTSNDSGLNNRDRDGELGQDGYAQDLTAYLQRSSESDADTADVVLALRQNNEFNGVQEFYLEEHSSDEGTFDFVFGNSDDEAESDADIGTVIIHGFSAGSDDENETDELSFSPGGADAGFLQEDNLEAGTDFDGENWQWDGGENELQDSEGNVLIAFEEREDLGVDGDLEGVLGRFQEDGLNIGTDRVIDGEIQLIGVELDDLHDQNFSEAYA
ncbi:hypothetical protein LRF89_06055 [Halorhodospira sp. 9621]|uniref:hypothetical protein n=1 Tax=Halorhodospira sp. 9621 TaxID=2899135 RepID=UPI001EE95A93|nr:hypothetical protein [Halorhodospira sp. 9621]MCG5533005.1 hypothetical protein [Halorhodospira sp. 9621]